MSYYLISFFLYLLDKKSFNSDKKQYAFSIIMLIGVPLILLGVFRYHAVSYVVSAENTIPTEINFYDLPEARIMFNRNSNSATGFMKHVVVEEDLLEEMRNQICKMKVKEVVKDNSKLKEPDKTLYISYQVKDRWYSKILNYESGIFEKRVANNRFAYYESKKLEHLLQSAIAKAEDIGIYTKATVYDYESIDSNGKKLSRDELSELVSMLNNSIVVEPKRTVDIETVLKKGVSKGDTHIYAIKLIQDETQNANQNFIVYDDINKVLFYDGEYYDADLSWINDLLVK